MLFNRQCLLRVALNLFHTFSPFTNLSYHYDLNDALTGGGFCADNANDVEATMFEMSTTSSHKLHKITPPTACSTHLEKRWVLRNGSSCGTAWLLAIWRAATDALITSERRSTPRRTTAIKYRIENTQKCASKYYGNEERAALGARTKCRWKPRAASCEPRAANCAASDYQAFNTV